MKRSFILFLLFILIVAIFVLPSLFTSSPKVQHLLKDTVSRELKAKVNYSDITWYWFPLPHLAFREAKVESPNFILYGSNAEIYPDWLSMLHGKFGVAGISLDDFHLLIKKISNDQDTSPNLPRWIEVRNGFIEISKNVSLPFPFPFKDRRPYIKKLYGKIGIDGPSVRLDLKGNTRQAQLIELKGNADLHQLTYSLKGHLRQFDLSALKINKLTKVKQFPHYGFINLDFSVSGNGVERSEGHIKAYSNCFVSGKSKKRVSAIFSCGSLELRYKYADGEANVVLESLDFKHPRLHLTGTLHFWKKDGLPWLKVDAKGRRLDLAEIRKVLLALSIRDKDVDDYCNVIRAGTVNWARVHLDAPASKWHSLSDMYIEGRAEDVKVYVKDEDFFVDSVSGPFEIVDGVLHVKEGLARLRNTKGSSGRLIFGLSKGREQFKLDIVLSAPPEDVKWALMKFTHEDTLHRELKRLSKLSGRIVGRLIIGDKKHDKKVKVQVQEARLSAFYKTLGAKVSIVQAHARYFDDTFSVSNFSGGVGPNFFKDVSAKVSWKDGHFKIKVNRGMGSVLAESILDFCNRFNLGQEFIDKYHVSASGRFRVKRLNLFFDAKVPSSFSYLVAGSPLGVSVETSLLPHKVFLKGGKLLVSTDKVSASRLKLSMAGSRFAIGLDLDHNHFHRWSGSVKVSGPVRRNLWKWLEKKGVELDEFTPRVPFFVRDFKLRFTKGEPREFVGTLYWKDDGISLFINARKSKGLFDLKRLSINAAGKRAELSFLKALGIKKRFSLGFKGELLGDTLDSILVENNMLDGRLQGDFSFGFSAHEKKAYSIDGRIHVEGFRWIWGLNDNLRFKKLDIEANKSHRGNVSGVIRLFDDKIGITGTFKNGVGGLVCSLNLSAPVLSSQTISFIQKMSEAQKGTDAGTSSLSDQEQAKLFRELAKRLDLKIGFKVKEARYAVTDFSKEKKQGSHEVVLKNLKGNAEVQKSRLKRLEAFSDDTCGLDVYLKKERIGDRVISEFSVITPKGRQALFEQVLDCLGVEQDLITGPVTFNLYLRGGERVLLGNGNLGIKAKDGYIHRFGLISKIFSVVNIVDIFSLNKGLLEGTSPYKKMLIDAKIASGRVHLEKAYIKGSGINFYGTGDVYLDSKMLDLIIFVQPLKTVDTIITSLPIIGGIIGGKNKSLFAIPVKVSGDWNDPKVDTLQTKTVTDIFKKLIFNVLTAPFSLGH